MYTHQRIVNHSIIVCTSGNASYLGQCLDAIKRHVTSLCVEVIIVNNNPTQILRDKVDKISETYGFKVVHELRPGLTFARHRGMVEAIGDVLSFIDDDVIISENWFASVTDVFSNQEVVLAGGPSRPIFQSSPQNWVNLTFNKIHPGQSVCIWLSLVDLGADADFVDPNMIWGLNFNVRKNLLVELGGFNPDLVPKSHERFQGDGETGLTQKIKELGLRSDYRQGILVHHVIPDSRLSFVFIKRRARYEGICNAYSAIRGNAPASSLTRELFKIAKSSFFSFKHLNFKFSFFVITWELYRAIGYFWLFSVYKRDHKVRNWIRIESYIDVNYPD